MVQCVPCKNPNDGDLTLPIYRLAHLLVMKPETAAERLVATMYIFAGMDVKRIWTRFEPCSNCITMRLIPGYLAQHLIPTILSGEYLQSPKKNQGNLVVEYGRTHPRSAFQLPHIQNLLLGSALTRILQHKGYTTLTNNYHDDIETHAIACLW